MAYESLKYKVLLKEKQFEIREYESFVSMGVSNGYGGGFSKLFNYITGYNNRSQKIAMTTPVITNTKKQDMKFTMPKDVVESGYPEPLDKSITIVKEDLKTVASFSFKGSFIGSFRNIKEHNKSLIKFIEEHGYTIKSDLLLMTYNGPYTPAPLKKYDLALSDLNSAISIDNRFPDLYYPLAEVMVKLKDLEGAISAYSEYIKLIPNSPQAYFDRGLMKYRNGDKLGACEDAQFSKSLNGLPIVGRALEMLLENSCPAKEHDDIKESIDETVAFALVEEVPVFPGCEEVLKANRRNCFQKQMQMHIAKNFRYPKIAQTKNIQGRVFVQFTIDIDGTVESIRTRGPHPILEKEAKRIISRLPKIKPGSKDGKLVKVPFSIPITFKQF